MRAEQKVDWSREERCQPLRVFHIASSLVLPSRITRTLPAPAGPMTMTPNLLMLGCWRVKFKMGSRETDKVSKFLAQPDHLWKLTPLGKFLSYRPGPLHTYSILRTCTLGRRKPGIPAAGTDTRRAIIHMAPVVCVFAMDWTHMADDKAYTVRASPESGLCLCLCLFWRATKSPGFIFSTSSGIFRPKCLAASWEIRRRM